MTSPLFLYTHLTKTIHGARFEPQPLAEITVLASETVTRLEPNGTHFFGVTARAVQCRARNPNVS